MMKKCRCDVEIAEVSLSIFRVLEHSHSPTKVAASLQPLMMVHILAQFMKATRHTPLNIHLSSSLHVELAVRSFAV
jgi:hypothetical protein